MASVYKPDGRNKYRIKFIDHKGQQKVAPGFRDKRATESLAAKIEEDADRVRAGLPPNYPKETGRFWTWYADRQRAFAEVVDDYLNELARHGFAPGSDHHRDSKTLLARIQKECSWKTLEDVRADQFTAFLGRLAAAGRAPRTQNRYHETLRAFLNFCVRQEWIKESPLDRLKPVKVGQVGRRRLRRAYTLEEFNSLLAIAGTANRRCYQVAAFSGFRANELRKLQKQDCTPTGDRPRWHVRAEVTKNGRAIRLPMTPECAEAIRAHWLTLPSPTSKLLSVPYKDTFKLHRQKANIPPQDERGRWADFHSLRYTFCLWCSQHFPIEVVAKLMRHGSLNLTTGIYLDLGIDREGEGGWILPAIAPKADVVPLLVPA